MPYTDYLSRGDNKSFFPLWIEISINILCDNCEFGKYLSVKIQHNYHIYHLKIKELSPFLVEYWILLHLYFSSPVPWMYAYFIDDPFSI
jgi:hypothetical protein